MRSSYTFTSYLNKLSANTRPVLLPFFSLRVPDQDLTQQHPAPTLEGSQLSLATRPPPPDLQANPYPFLEPHAPHRPLDSAKSHDHCFTEFKVSPVNGRATAGGTRPYYPLTRLCLSTLRDARFLHPKCQHLKGGEVRAGKSSPSRHTEEGWERGEERTMRDSSTEIPSQAAKRRSGALSDTCSPSPMNLHSSKPTTKVLYRYIVAHYLTRVNHNVHSIPIAAPQDRRPSAVLFCQFPFIPPSPTPHASQLASSFLSS